MNFRKNIFLFSTLLSFLIPIFSFAVDANSFSDNFLILSIGGLIDLIGSLLPLVIGIAVLVFLIGLLKYVVANDDKKKEGARTIILWGLIILAVMVSVWGLVSIIQGLFGVDSTNNARPDFPSFPTKTTI